MKKVTSLLLALVMALALAVPAFAEDLADNEVTGDKTQNVTADVSVTEDQTVSVYHVTVAWKTPSFSYSFGGTKYTWNTEGLNYDGEAIKPTGWGDNSAGSQDGTLELTVTNRSDKVVYCKAALVKNDAQTNLNVKYDGSTDGVKTATAGTIVTDSNNPSAYTNPHTGEAPTANLGGKITMSGTPNKTAITETGVVLATITLTLSKTALS